MEKMPFQVNVNDKSFDVSPSELQNFDIIAINETHFHILKDNQSFKAEIIDVDKKAKTFTFKINNTVYISKVLDKYDRLIDQLGMKIKTAQSGGDIKAPMPGLVLEVSVETGQQVLKGDKVLILEAMKMENVIKAAGDGVIKAIHITQGKAVEKGQLLIEIS